MSWLSIRTTCTPSSLWTKKCLKCCGTRSFGSEIFSRSQSSTPSLSSSSSCSSSSSPAKEPSPSSLSRYSPSVLDITDSSLTSVMFQDAGAGSLISARDCALTIGITYFLSALLSLVMKNLLGRRLLMLVSLLGKTIRNIYKF